MHDKLQDTSIKYKQQTDKRRKELQFKVGDMVMVHLNKERLPKKMHTKLLMKNIGPFKIVKKCRNNAYQIDFPPNINVSLISNVSDMHAFKGAFSTDVDASTLEELKEELKKILPSMPKLVVDTILDKRIKKKTRRHTYYEYLVHWKGQTAANATWLTEKALKAYGIDPSHFTTLETGVSFM